MNNHKFFLSFSLILLLPSFASSNPEFIKISPAQKDSTIARKQKRKIALEQRLQEIQQLKNKKEQVIKVLDNKIKDAKYEIISLERELVEYSEDLEMQKQITSESDDFKAKLRQYENQRRWLQEDNEALSQEVADINEQLLALR